MTILTWGPCNDRVRPEKLPALPGGVIRADRVTGSGAQQTGTRFETVQATGQFCFEPVPVATMIPEECGAPT